MSALMRTAQQRQNVHAQRGAGAVHSQHYNYSQGRAIANHVSMIFQEKSEQLGRFIENII